MIGQGLLSFFEPKDKIEQHVLKYVTIDNRIYEVQNNGLTLSKLIETLKNKQRTNRVYRELIYKMLI